MATMFEPSSSIRAPFSSVHGPSHADNLPSINFGFDELRDRMAKFTTKFDAFIEAGRKRVLEERNQFHMNVAELKEDDAATRKRISHLESQSASHAQTLSREAAETSEMASQIADLTSQRDAHLAAKETLTTRIGSVQSSITRLTSAQAAHTLALQTQSRHDIPELDFWVQNLGLKIEGAGVGDRIKFSFMMVDEADFASEAWFLLDCSKRDYEVRRFWPKVERERVDRLVEGLNEKRELGGILRGMRELFVEAFKENK